MIQWQWNHERMKPKTCAQCLFKMSIWSLEYCILGNWHGADHQTPCADWAAKAATDKKIPPDEFTEGRPAVMPTGEI